MESVRLLRGHMPGSSSTLYVSADLSITSEYFLPTEVPGEDKDRSFSFNKVAEWCLDTFMIKHTNSQSLLQGVIRGNNTGPIYIGLS